MFLALQTGKGGTPPPPLKSRGINHPSQGRLCIETYVIRVLLQGCCRTSSGAVVEGVMSSVVLPSYLNLLLCFPSPVPLLRERN